MSPESFFKTNEETAKAISSMQDAKMLTLRPYNFYMSAFTEWWFIPSTIWPAYQFGKLFIWKSPEYSSDPNKLYVGYYIEHGIGSDMASLSGIKKNIIMKNNWTWFEFIEKGIEGKIDKIMQNALSASQCSLYILLKAYEFNQIVKTDEKLGTPSDTVEFKLEASQNVLKNVRMGKKIFHGFNSINYFSELCQILKNSKDLQFFWIDLLIGIHLDFEGNAPAEKWSARDIWDKALGHWMPLVK